MEFNKKVSINFVDFKKAFDSVHRETVWNIAKVYGIPQNFISIFKNLYLNSSCCIKTGTSHTEFFDIVSGVRQGCILSPLLFLLTIDFVMRTAMNDTSFGIKWNAARLTDLDFADDLALLGDTPESLQAMTDNLASMAAKVGLRINTQKTKVMAVKEGNPITVQVNNQTAEEVDSFTYLGSNISNKGDTAQDIHSRLGKASAVFRKLNSIWTSKRISLKSKVTLLNSLVIPVAIYASETWKMTEKMAHKIDVFHQRCLRKLLV